MCTVSYVFAHNKIIITSNRDEKVVRPNAVEPKGYLVNNKNIIFPKDQKAGGTWYAITEQATVVVLLNGATEKHELKPSYRKSRGLIVLDIISADSPIDAWETIYLTDIEPFTLIVFQDKKLYQLRWNEREKEILQLDATKNFIWSSSTLYSQEIRDKRAIWFDTFIDTKPEVDEAEMFNFHRYAEGDNKEDGLVINRNDVLKTLSITQAVIDKNKVVLSHYDLQQQKEFVNSFITL